MSSDMPENPTPTPPPRGRAFDPAKFDQSEKIFADFEKPLPSGEGLGWGLKAQKLIATVFGAGLLPIAPGTWGAAVGAAVLLFFQGFDEKKVFVPLFFVVVFLSWLGALIAENLEKTWGEDPKKFVLDEFVGVLATLLTHALTWQNIALGFVFFRFFDIAKPLGIRKFEKIGGGWAVMADDLAAAFWANLTLWAARLFFFENPFFSR